MMSESFLATIDRNLAPMGFSDRSSFLREAAMEKLRRSGVPVDTSQTVAPSRTGKGGRPYNVEVFPSPTARVAETNEPVAPTERKKVNYRTKKKR